MNSYGALADCYDGLTYDVDYSRLAGRIHQQLEENCEKNQISGKIILDLACGTGSLTFELAKLGYEMIGVDQSSEMLSQASEKSCDIPTPTPLFLCQSMERLDLFGSVDGCVCSLDSLNYITELDKLKRALERVFLFLVPGGMFIFDIKTPEMFALQNRQVTVDETEKAFCVWRSEYDESTHLCHHFVDLFENFGEKWSRFQEEHLQRGYSLDTMTRCLTEVGFEEITTYPDLKNSPWESSRLFFSAVKAKKG